MAQKVRGSQAGEREVIVGPSNRSFGLLFTLRRLLAIVAVNLILLVVCAEIAGLFLYYLDTGRFFYTHQKSYERLTAEATAGRLTGDALHPYFGPTHQPGLPFDIPDRLREQPAGASAAPAGSLRTNNFGFVSGHAFPFVKTDGNQFVIGLFGGSVGVWFCQIGAGRLVANLEKEEYFRNRQLIPLCFSHEGYKQPQQLLVLAYFLSIGQQFDLVVNIDGFNEVALAPLNEARGLDISMPSPLHLGPLVNLLDRSTLTPGKLSLLAAIQHDREQLDRLAEGLERTRIASVHVALDWYRQRISSRYSAELGRFANLPPNPAATSIVRVTPPVAKRDDATLFRDVAAQWVESSLLMNALLRTRGVPYFHVLQPNQYFSSRRFSDAERAIAFSGDSPFKDGAEKGYPALVAASSALTGREQFLNGVTIFDEETRPVYMDNCCHYTLAGNQVLADYVARAIVSSAGSWRKSTRGNEDKATGSSDVSR